MARKFEFFGSYTSFLGLLDLFPTATLGFSLRKLSNSYNGNCIRVRRSSDNAALDIGFVNNVIDTASLLSFVGSGSGFVTIWYNQATNNNATQTTAVNQPRIVNAGVLEVKNGEPCLQFSGNQWFNLGSTITEINSTTALVMGRTDSNPVRRMSIFGTSVNANCASILLLSNILFLQRQNGFSQTTSADTLTNQSIYFAQKGVGVTKVFKNTNELASTFTPSAINNTFNQIGRYTTNNPIFTDGQIQEIVYWQTDEIANKVGIETNINSFYGTY